MQDEEEENEEENKDDQSSDSIHGTSYTGKTKEQKKKKLKEPLKTGDKLSFLAFDHKLDREWDIGGDLEMYFVTSILNFQRQFAACKIAEHNADFGEELWGKAPATEDECAIRAVSRENDTCDSGIDCVVNTNDKIDIPLLNDAQQKATNDFLSNNGKRIRIVQG